MTSFSTDRLTEKVETLDGARAGNRERAAVRVSDIQALLQLPAKLKSAKAAGAAPTKAEHDALVEDIDNIHKRLREIAALLQNKLLS